MEGERKTLVSFGGLIHSYKIDEAVADEAVVPLLYEGRMVEQQISAGAIDVWFDKISKGLSEQQEAVFRRGLFL
jgi:type I restriction enzyme, R subunit